MTEKLRALRGALCTKIKNAIHEVFTSLPSIDSTKTLEILEWKKLPVVKESFDKLFKPMNEDNTTTHMDYIIRKLWSDPENDSNIQIAWAISIAKIYLNPHNSIVRIEGNIAKESIEKNLVSILLSNEILRKVLLNF